MNMKKTSGVKKLIVLVFSLTLAVVLAACGGTGSPANGGEDIPAEPAPSHPYNIGYINVGGRTIDIRVLPSANISQDDIFRAETGLLARLELALDVFEDFFNRDDNKDDNRIEFGIVYQNFLQLRIIEVTGLAALTNVSARPSGILYGEFASTGGLVFEIRLAWEEAMILRCYVQSL